MSKVLQSKYESLTPIRKQVVRHALKAAFGIDTCLEFRVGYMLDMVKLGHLDSMSEYQARIVFKLITGFEMTYDMVQS